MEFEGYLFQVLHLGVHHYSLGSTQIKEKVLVTISPVPSAVDAPWSETPQEKE